jgi:hypothetical protein
MDWVRLLNTGGFLISIIKEVQSEGIEMLQETYIIDKKIN